MAAKWRGNTLSVAIAATGTQAVNRLIWKVNDIANMVLSQAADDMVSVIESTPSSINPTKTNRVDTGLMRDSVDVTDMSVAGTNRYAGSAGWIYVVEDYFFTQEYGGTSSGLRRGDQTITPMHMLSKAFYKMKENLSNELGRI